MNLRAVRKKTKSIKNVKKITRAMQLVSAVKMRKAQEAELDGRPYRVGLIDIMERITPFLDRSYSSLLSLSPSKDSRHLVVYISSNKGLCGTFHMTAYRYLAKEVPFESTDFITVGKKGAVFVSRMHSNVIADFSSHDAQIEVSAIFQLVLEKFLSGSYASVSLVYNKFLSALRFETVRETLLPFQVKRGVQKNDHTPKSEYLIEPSPELLIDQLLRSYIEDRIRSAIVSSQAAEHAARMMAMKTATDNATDVIYTLTLVGNKLRQEKITGELLDMITAKESVEQS